MLSVPTYYLHTENCEIIENKATNHKSPKVLKVMPKHCTCCNTIIKIYGHSFTQTSLRLSSSRLSKAKAKVT